MKVYKDRIWDMRNDIKNVSEFSLKGKLLLITSGITIIALIVVGLTFYQNLKNETTRLLQQQTLAIAKSAAMLIDGDEFERLSLSLDAEDKYYEEGLSLLKELNTKIREGKIYTIVDQDEDYYTYVIDGSGTVSIGHKQQKLDFAEEAAHALERGKSYYSKPYYVKELNKYYISAFSPLFNSQNKVVGIIEYDYEDARVLARTKEIAINILYVIILLSGFILVINYFIIKKLFRPIEQLVSSIETIAQGDLTLKLSLGNYRETGKINYALNETVCNIRCILEKIKQASKKVMLATKSILVSSKDATEVYDELAVSTNKILDTTKKQLSESRKIGADLEKLQQKIQNIYQNVETNQEGASKIYDATIQGFKIMEETEQKIIRIENRLGLADQAMSQLGHYMNKMNDMIVSILKISEQATLLGLKIEDNSLGKEEEETKSIVANVRKLLRESNIAMSEIEEVIQVINSQISFISTEVCESTKLIGGGLNVTFNNKELLMTINHENQNLREQINDMHKEMEEAVVKVSTMKESIHDIEKVSELIDSHTMNLLAIMQEQAATSDEFKVMVELLYEQAKLLDDSISQFKV